MRFPQSASAALFAAVLFTACASDPNAPRTLSDKDRVDSLLSIAIAQVNEQDPTGALQTLAQIQDLNAKLPEAYYLYALAYLQKNEMRLATESARRAVALKPQYSAAKNTLGKLLLDQGKFSEAEKYLSDAANDLLNRESALAKLNLGVLYYKKTDYPKAEVWLQKSMQERGPMSCLAAYYLGKVRLLSNDLAQAERSFKLSAKENCSAMSEAHIALGQTLVREKKYDQARAKFVEIQRLFPSTAASDQAAQYLREIP